MNRTLASADTAHYYQWPAQLSTLPAAGRADRKHAGSTRSRLGCVPARLPTPTVVGLDPNARAQLIDARTVLKSDRRDQR